jgi:hypothetical protein
MFQDRRPNSTNGKFSELIGDFLELFAMIWVISNATSQFLISEYALPAAYWKS